jgi:putative ATPase
MKDLDYGKDYRYAHNENNAYAAGEQYLPNEIASKQYYLPTERGLEKKIGEKLAYLRSLDGLEPK